MNVFFNEIKSILGALLWATFALYVVVAGFLLLRLMCLASIVAIMWPAIFFIDFKMSF